MTLLVRTPTPYPTESLFGYLLRVSEENGYDTPTTVLGLAGLTHHKPGRFPHSLLAAVLGFEEQRLRHLSYYGPEGQKSHCFFLLSREIGGGFLSGIRFGNPALCPHCVAERGYIDAFWDLEAVTACPTHRCMLLEHCPTCKERLHWYRPGLLTCRCQADLANTTLYEANPLLVAWMAVLRQKLLARPLAELGNDMGMPLSDMEAIPLKVLLSIVERLRSQGKMSGLADDCAIAALANWPAGYHDYLRSVGNAASETSEPTVGLNTQFKGLRASLFAKRSDRVYTEFLHSEYLRFGLTKWGKSVVYSRYSKGLDFDKRYLSLKELSERTSLNAITLVKWIDKGLLPVTAVKSTRGVRYVIDTEKVGLERQSEGVCVRTGEAARSLGLSEKVFKSVKASGDFEVKHQPAQKIAVHEKDIAAFRERLLQAAPAMSGPRPGPASKYCTLTHALGHMKFGSTAAKAGFVRAYLNNTIAAEGRWGTTLDDIYFDKEKVLAIACDGRVNANDGTVSRAAAGRMLGCPEEAIPGLLAAGHLAEEVATDGFTYVVQASVELFASTYEALARLARTLGTTVKRLHRLAKNAGIPLLEIEAGYNKGTVTSFIYQEDVARLREECAKNPARVHKK